jgi:hypothetical protein
MGSGCIDSRFLELGTSWRWMVNLKPQPPYPQMIHWYPLGTRLRGPQGRSELRGQDKNLAATGTRTPDTSVVPPVASRVTSRLHVFTLLNYCTWKWVQSVEKSCTSECFFQGFLSRGHFMNFSRETKRDGLPTKQTWSHPLAHLYINYTTDLTNTEYILFLYFFPLYFIVTCWNQNSLTVIVYKI